MPLNLLSKGLCGTESNALHRSAQTSLPWSSDWYQSCVLERRARLVDFPKENPHCMIVRDGGRSADMRVNDFVDMPFQKLAEYRKDWDWAVIWRTWGIARLGNGHNTGELPFVGNLAKFDWEIEELRQTGSDAGGSGFEHSGGYIITATRLGDMHYFKEVVRRYGILRTQIPQGRHWGQGLDWNYDCLASFPGLPHAPPAFDRFQYAPFLHTGSDQKLEVWKAWERGYDCPHSCFQPGSHMITKWDLIFQPYFPMHCVPCSE